MADKALLAGINDYAKISDLRGCLNDLQTMKGLLVNSFGFDEDNIRTLTDKEVLYDRIVDEFAWLYEDAEEGDRLVFHFSGHGSYIDSVDDDEAVDELLCLYNMDWDDPDSYLLDDDLGNLLSDLPDGVKMTVIVDACHAESTTKAISPTGRSIKNVTSKSRLLIIDDSKNTISKSLPKDFDEKLQKGGQIISERVAKQAPYARFVQPPASIRNKLGKAQRKSLGRNIDDLNHQLLAGAMDTQTAADAYIDGKYQGAFTYYLCDTSNSLGVDAAVNNIMDTVRSRLSQAGYSQIPQMEGLRQQERLFGGPATVQSSNDFEQYETFESEPFANSSFKSGGLTPLDAFSRLVDVHEKFLDLSQQLLSAGSSQTGKLFESVESRSSATEQIVYVHGISQHRPGYSDSWFAAMQPHLSRNIPKSEVIWSDLVNPRSLQSKAESSEMARLAEEIKKEIEARQRQDAESSGQRSVAPKGLFDSGFKMDDFLRYMMVRETREQILDRFFQVVIPLLEQGKKIHIVAHSWGTAVSYEGMRRLDARNFTGRVENLFTVGAALSISPVQWNLFDRLTDGRKPNHVKHIYNVHSGGDPVGGRIENKFTIDKDFPKVAPTGCTTYPFTQIAINPVCAHSSYFNRDNMATNRDIFARIING